MHKVYKLKEMLCNELEEYGSKEKLDAASLEVVDKLAHAIKNIDKIIETYEEQENGGSSYARGGGGGGRSNAGGSYGNSYGGNSYGGSYNSYGGEGSYARGRGRNARRDSMGRYSRNEGGYSGAEDFRMELQELMQDAPNDYVRQKMMDVMQGM